MSAARDEFNELMRDKERRTAHPDDDDDRDARSFLNLSDDEDGTPSSSHTSRDQDTSRQPMNERRPVIPNTRYQANTGPKGVISDAQNFRDSRRMHRKSMRTTAQLPAQSQNSLSVREQPPAEKRAEDSDEEEDGDTDDENNDEAHADEDEFMRKWRKSRLRQLQIGPPNSLMHSRQRSKRVWGSLTAVDGGGYLDAVDRSPADTVVVVYIYDDSSEVSASIEDCLRSLARTHSQTRFVKLHYLDAEMEPAGVPAVLAYRGGEKFAGLVPVIHEIPEDADLDAGTLEYVLRRHQILR